MKGVLAQHPRVSRPLGSAPVLAQKDGCCGAMAAAAGIQPDQPYLYLPWDFQDLLWKSFNKAIESTPWTPDDYDFERYWERVFTRQERMDMIGEYNYLLGKPRGRTQWRALTLETFPTDVILYGPAPRDWNRPTYRSWREQRRRALEAGDEDSMADIAMAAAKALEQTHGDVATAAARVVAAGH